jgi:AcrR family transcriptional regulator
MPGQTGERKRHLLEQARALVAAHGFGGVTMAALAEAAGITPALLARSFRNRAALRRALVDDLRAETFPPPESMANAPKDPAGRLLAWLDRARKEAARPSEGFRLLIRALTEVTDADGRADLHAQLLEWSEPLIQLLQKCQQAGVIRRALDPQVAAWDLLQVILGHALLGPRDSATADVAPPFDSLLQGVLKVDV